MAFSSPSKIPRVEGQEFNRIRDQFCLLAYSFLDDTVNRSILQQEFIELAVKVMRKMAGMEAEKKFLWKELEKSRCKLNETEKELEVSKASLDFLKNDILEVKAEDGEEEEQSSSSMLTVEENTDE
ncbi:hypothetical protein KOW79_011783 [Hemibagrus wyckioides]|uniref:Uncharacterized protein n=1 Tax=Hemibagrus wyckioides TaxID=337641 RepID=A0A9D3NNI5_9TELE|nr:hypothetical protein KOW79_011783 [Hemibagrus wyckioides]